MEQDPRDSRRPEQEIEPEGGRDASDVVDGPVGDAHLVDPVEAEPLSADLDALPAIDDKEPPDSQPPDTGSEPAG